MHSHVEIVIPTARKDDIEAAVREVLEPFDEHAEKDGAFWDYYLIGGRFSGAKVEAGLDPERVTAFHAELHRREVTIAGVQAGKPSLHPVTQIPAIDALYREWFPEGGPVCPFFSHYDDPSQINPADICSVANTPRELQCDRLIIARPHWDDPAKLEAKRMFCNRLWNGIEHQQTEWDGKVRDTLMNLLGQGTPLFDGDSLMVTVDTHS